MRRYIACVSVLASALAAGACQPSEPAPPAEGTSQAAAVDDGSAAAAAEPEATEEIAEEETPAEPVAEEPAAEPTWEEQVAASEPLAPQVVPQTVGEITLTAQPCTIEGYTFVDDSSMDVIGAFEVVGDAAYIVDPESNVRRFTIADTADGGCSLTLDASFGRGGVMDFERDIESISSSNDGTVIMSNGVFESQILSGSTGVLLSPCEARSHGFVVLHPAGGWGLGRYVSPEVKRVTLSPDGCTAEPWPWQSPFQGLSAVGFVGDLIIAGGSLAEEVNGRRPHVLVAFDTGGNEVWRQGNVEESFADDGYGWFHAIEACPWGVCVLDSNFRALHLVTAGGTHVGKVALGDLLGLRYAWFADLDVVGDTVWIVAGQERGDSDVYEGLVYRITAQPG